MGILFIDVGFLFKKRGRSMLEGAKLMGAHLFVELPWTLL
ncbi:hypothetical protein LINGRAHAP2_LOCUS10953 [Linum grandiflorum]